MNMRNKLTTIMMLAICLTGCGQIIGVPNATTRQLTRGDVVGLWTKQDSRAMKSDAADVTYTLSIQINGDSTYTQTIDLGTGAPPIVNKGTWALNGANITFSNMRVETWDFDQGTWRAQREQWWFIDELANTPPVALYGGLKSALESYGKFTKIR
jgi:hypothetical protein